MQRINSVILGLLLACPAFAQSPRIDRFAMHEIGFAAEGPYANPYTDLSADATITPPNSGQPRNATLFWDGGAKWKLRIAPDEVGAWKWTVKSRDSGLDGKSGTFECVAGSRRGSIRPMKDHPLHFERQDGSPFWFLGDTAWALYTDSENEKHDRTAALAYIDARAAQGFNVLHSMLLSEAGWGNRGGQPFDDIAAQKLNPGFWQEVDFRLAHANAKGIVCGLALAWGDKGRNEGYAWRQFADAAARQRYARYVVSRYGAYDTYFLVSGEWHAEIRSRRDTADAVRNEFIEIGNAAAAVDPQRRMMAIHPMTAEGSVREYNAAKWMSFGDYQQNYRDLHGRLLMSRSANKPIVNSEYGYFLRDQSGDGVPDKDNSTSLTAMRHATWDIAMAGGYVVTGFGTTYFGGNRDPGPFDLEASKNKPWEEQIGHVKSIFSQLQWWKLQPHDELLTCEAPRGEEGKEFERLVPPATTYWCLAEPGRQYLVYFRGLKSPLTLSLQVKPGQLTATQINPRTGERRVLGGASTDRFEIRPPDEQDWAVLISAPADRVERAGQGRIHYVTYRSQLNNQDVPVMVYTPRGYETSGERYPVVYNLHGAGGGNPARQWDRIQATLTDAMDHAKARPVIYVFVNGLGDTFFVDSADQKLPVESSIVQELIPLIDKNYRTIASRDGRALDGFSMGGFGCLMLALKHPELFSSVVSYGAALISAERAGIGAGKRFASQEHFDRYSPSTLVEKNADTIRRGLKIRMVCGDADSLHASNVEFTNLLSRLNIPVSWVSVPGVGHDTKGLYQRVGLESLKFMEASFPPRPVAARSSTNAKVVFEVDLTKGSAGAGVVTGGSWENGWRTTGAKDERIVFDAGGPIANGTLETSFTIDELPWASHPGKINYIGLHEDASLSQNKHDGDLFYARTGNVNYKFSNVKATGRRFDRGEHEPRVGSAEDWIADSRTVHTIKLQWRDGVPIFHDPKGRVTVFPRDIIGGDTPVDRLRYIFLGSDNFTGLTVKGMRFLRVKLIDEGPDADAPPPEPLKVSENGHFLVSDSGRPVFLLADTAWGLVHQLKRDEIEEYLRQRRSQRFNAVTFVLYSPGNPDIADGTKTIYGQSLFELFGGRPDPAQPRLTPGANPASPAEYDFWDHVDYTVGLTKRLGMYAIVLPCWGSAVVGDYSGKASADQVVDASKAAIYGRWLAQRYGREPHVLWMLGGDRRAVQGDRDYRPVFQALAKGLADGGSSQLISYHPPKRSPQSGDWFHSDPWLSFNSNQHWPEDQLPTIARDWSAAPTKPSWLFEGRYEGYWKNNYKPDDWGQWQCRQQAWQTVVAGAFGHTYGHERVFGFGRDNADWRAAMDSPGARSMTHLAKFMNYLGPSNALNRQPDQSLLANDEGKAERLSSDRITISRTANSRFVLAYTASGRPIRLHMDKLATGPLFGWWFNPRTGGWIQNGVESPNGHPFARDIASGSGTPPREFDPPGDSGPGQDWVLVLNSSEGL